MTVKYPLQRQTVQVKKDTIFYAKSFSHAFSVKGTRSDGFGGPVIQSSPITLPETVRLNLFDYSFKIHDTGSDREWQDNWVPGSVLLTGNYNGLRLRKGHALCSPGSEISIDVDASTFGNSENITHVTDITSQQLQIVIAGFEVPFKEGA